MLPMIRWTRHGNRHAIARKRRDSIPQVLYRSAIGAHPAELPSLSRNSDLIDVPSSDRTDQKLSLATPE